METAVYLDTHVVVWLYAGRLNSFSDKAKIAIQEKTLLVSPIVRLEVQYLYEIKRIKVPAEKILNNLEKDVDLFEYSDNLSKIIKKAENLNWTRDPFDRIIVAQAQLSGKKLITKDLKIRKNFKQTIW